MPNTVCGIQNTTKYIFPQSERMSFNLLNLLVGSTTCLPHCYFKASGFFHALNRKLKNLLRKKFGVMK